MSYYSIFGEGTFAIKTTNKSRNPVGRWSAKFGNPYANNRDSKRSIEHGFHRLRKNRKFSFYLDNGDKEFDKKTDQLLSRFRLSRKEHKQFRKVDSGNVFFEYANWEIHPDSCSDRDYCWGEEFVSNLSTRRVEISGTIPVALGHRLFNDFLWTSRVIGRKISGISIVYMLMS